MKRIVTALGATALLLVVLQWAALHDLLKGKESDYWLEDLVLAAGSVLYGPLAALHDVVGGNEENYLLEYGVLYVSLGALAFVAALFFLRRRTRAVRKASLAGGVVILIALDWAAVHDIFKANEPSYVLEYSILTLSAAALAALAVLLLRYRRAQLPHA